MSEQNQEDQDWDSVLPSLVQMTGKNFAGYEQQLQEEFKTLSQDYISARQARTNHLRQSINNYIKVFSDNEKNWGKIYSFELETIANMKTNTENLILSDLKLQKSNEVIDSLEEYELELREMMNNKHSPLDLDAVFQPDFFNPSRNSKDQQTISFQRQFEAIVEPFATCLKAITQESESGTRLMNSNIEAYQKIMWKQYYHDVISRKNRLIEETYAALNNLHNEYHGLNENEQNIKDIKHYYRSVIPTSAFKPDVAPVDQDFHYSTDNPHYKKNRIELTNIRRDILQNLKAFESQQHHHGYDFSTKLNGCLSLSKQEIDQDLALILGKEQDSPTKEEVFEEEDYVMDVDRPEREELHKQMQDMEKEEEEKEVEAKRLRWERDVEKVMIKEKESEALNRLKQKALEERPDSALTPEELIERKYNRLIASNSVPGIEIPETPPIQSFPH